ncbi:MAG: 50S ribosomal protein L17 [Bdellovibrionota bacterium]|jgi:large subunit ribosomal protein L17
MRHSKAFRKFNRTPSHRRAMLRNLATSFLKHGKIKTTLQKAKDLRGVVEKYITLAGEDNLHNRRLAYSYLTDKAVVHKLFAEIGPKYKTRPGGYTRILKLDRRAGDAAKMAFIMLVEEDYQPKVKRERNISETAPEAVA